MGVSKVDKHGRSGILAYLADYGQYHGRFENRGGVRMIKYRNIALLMSALAIALVMAACGGDEEPETKRVFAKS